MSRVITKQELTPHALNLFKRVKAGLPPSIAQRLRSHRGFVTHKSYAGLFLFDVWDAHQSDVLPRNSFKYCLSCDQRPGAKHSFFHLWISRSRIYREREEIIATLDRELPGVTPPEFVYHRDESSNLAFNIGFDFNYPRDLSTFPDILLPRYLSLISAVHPVLMPIINRFSMRLAPGERRAVCAKRGRLLAGPTGVYNRVHVREYSRSVQSYRNDTFLARFGHRCPSCHADLRVTGYHIDHIIPWRLGGTGASENVQPLCPRCNLNKGGKAPQ